MISKSVKARASRSNESCWRLYIVKCSDGTYYTGISTDVDKRVSTHNTGKGAKYTSKRRPVSLQATSRVMTQGEALSLEHKIKQLPRDQKIKGVQEC